MSGDVQRGNRGCDEAGPQPAADAVSKVCLVVDDSRVIRTVISNILKTLNMTVLEAGNGRQALEICNKTCPDLILLDWNMPVMDGLECLRALRAAQNEHRPIVVMCTTECTLPKIKTAIAEGADEYIMKPFSSEILIQKLECVGLPVGA